MSVCLGIGLSAACGFRIFVPMLAISIASLSGHLHLAHGFEWIGTYPALMAFSVATCLEIAGYYVPWIDHLLDTVATPAAIVAGTVATASVATDMSPFLKWTLAAIAGGGVAGAVQATTVVMRGASTLTTGGLGNWLVATMELAGSVATTILAFLAPLLVVLLVAGFLFVFGRKLLHKVRKAQASISAVS